MQEITRFIRFQRRFEVRQLRFTERKNKIRVKELIMVFYFEIRGTEPGAPRRLDAAEVRRGERSSASGPGRAR